MQPLRQQALLTGWLPLKLLFQQNRPVSACGCWSIELKAKHGTCKAIGELNALTTGILGENRANYSSMNTTHYDTMKLIEIAVSDKKVQVISNESIHNAHMSLMDRAYAKRSDGMPRDMTINDFMRHPQICSKARAKLAANNINVPGNWCPDDERAVMQSVDREARHKVESEWEVGTKKRLGQVVGPDLTEQQFKSLKSVNDAIVRALADAPCTQGNA